MQTSTFVDNMKLPIHKWFRYTAGFSAEWAGHTIRERLAKHDGGAGHIQVLDPFAGSGTTLLAADDANVTSFGYESHPLISRIAQTKLEWDVDIPTFNQLAQEVLNIAKADCSGPYDYPALVHKCYDKTNLVALDHLRKALEAVREDSKAWHMAWLAFVCIIRPTSHAGTAIGQYVLPSHGKARVASVQCAYLDQVQNMTGDLIEMQSHGVSPQAHLIEHDARNPYPDLDNSIDLVVTSPPYANNYDYADATRLEMSVLGEITGWSDLQDIVRPGLIRSCTQMVSKERKDTYKYVDDPMLNPIHDELTAACREMELERENHGGKKNYHTMAALYFYDMAHVFSALRLACKAGSELCFVIGDSAPYGVYMPVDKWLAELALSAGFESWRFEKLRDRNTKWKNRKHRVPLKEGHLWIWG